jgi:hypothetical protein
VELGFHIQPVRAGTSWWESWSCWHG